MTQQCPCKSGAPYSLCCAPFHLGKSAPSPFLLMRSRYAAYAMGNAEYIMATTDPEGPFWRDNLNEWKKEILDFSLSTVFQNLEIMEAQGDFVTFKAYLSQGAMDVSFTEKSLFKLVNGRWLYFEGELA